MTTKTNEANDQHTNSVAPKMHPPVTWDIRGSQNNWNWKVQGNVDGVADEIVYQTRFPEKDLALLYRGVGDAAVLLATISNETLITFPSTTNKEQNPPFELSNTSDEMYSFLWPVRVKALGGRELNWEYVHPVQSGGCMYLRDPASKEVLGSADNNYMELRVELPEDAVEELIITGTAAMIELAPLMHNDMTIAVLGLGGESYWKYQVPNWEDEEEEEKGDDITEADGEDV